MAGKEKMLCVGDAFDIYAKDFSASFKSRCIKNKTFSDEPLASSLAYIAWGKV